MPVVATLMAVVGIVLLIACANLAGLLLAKAAGRQREVAVRLAVGASRGRLVRQFLIESALLAAAGGAAGIVISYWTSGMLTFFVPPTPFPVNFTAELSPMVLAFSVATTFGTALVFGLLPALKASRPNLVESLKESVGTLVKGRSRGWLRQSLVVGQIALSMILLLGAALFARSFTRAQLVDPGFSLRTGFLASLDLLPNGYDEARGIVFYQQLLQRVTALPGVEAVSIATAMPLDIGTGSDMGVRIDGYQARPGEEISVTYNRVGPGYFEAMGVPIVQGRGVDERDTAGREVSVVINETMAKRYFAGRDPVGGLVYFGIGPARVVGVAKDGKYSKLNEQPQNYMYVPVFQFYRPDVALIVRTTGDPASVVPQTQSTIKQLDPNLPLFDIRTIAEHLAARTLHSANGQHDAGPLRRPGIVAGDCGPVQRHRVQRRAADEGDRHSRRTGRRPRGRPPADSSPRDLYQCTGHRDRPGAGFRRQPIDCQSADDCAGRSHQLCGNCGRAVRGIADRLPAARATRSLHGPAEGDQKGVRRGCAAITIDTMTTCFARGLLAVCELPCELSCEPPCEPSS